METPIDSHQVSLSKIKLEDNPVVTTATVKGHHEGARSANETEDSCDTLDSNDEQSDNNVSDEERSWTMNQKEKSVLDKTRSNFS